MGCRTGIWATRPDFAGYQSIIRLAGPEPVFGGWNIRQPKLAGNFKFVLIFGLLSLSIIILIIISHVELHNKIVFTV